MENVPKNEFLVFALFDGNFQNKHHYTPENSENILFLVLLSKMIIPKVIRA